MNQPGNQLTLYCSQDKIRGQGEREETSEERRRVEREG
jgi:hypothetical protein